MDRALNLFKDLVRPAVLMVRALEQRISVLGLIFALLTVSLATSCSLALASPLNGGVSQSAFYFLTIFCALSVLGVLIMVLRSMGRGRAYSAGFQDLFQGSDLSAAMTDAAGRLLSVNTAFQLKGGAGAGTLIGSAIAAWCADADAVAYRLANGALRRGSARETIALEAGGAAHIEVIRTSQQRLLWVISPVPETIFASVALEKLPRFTLSGEGEVLKANDAFAALSKADRSVAVRECFSELSEGSVSTQVFLSGGLYTRFSTTIAGDVDIVLVPVQEGKGDRSGSVFEELPVALVRLSQDGRIIAANQAARLLLGEDATEAAMFSEIVEGLGCPIDERIEAAAAGKPLPQSDLARGTRKDKEVYVRVAFRNISGRGDGGLFAVLNDATDLRTLEQQFVQSQKMQAVGQLAGGVAHDFNNLLTAILGHCDLLTIRRDEADPDFEDLSQIRQNANRAAALVRQLLAFSRQQKLTPKSCTLVDTLAELSHLLDRLIGERIALSVECATDVWRVWIDEPQFEQVIVNLVVNARDAMPNGGAICIRCRNVELEEPLRRDRAVVPPGEYVEITVSDQGTGMPEEIAAKVFEPFFTTKPAGKGTGLGLSTAYGIIKQTGGFIFVDSVPGEGAVFRIFFRRHISGTDAPEVMALPLRDRVDLSGSGKILLVEDEAPVRAFASRALKLRGYEVEEAIDGEAALSLIESKAGAFDLVVSDVVMPGIDGPTWVKRARASYPALPVIFTSGYAEDVFRNGLGEIEDCDFLPKPFTLDDLATAVKRRLAREEHSDTV